MLEPLNTSLPVTSSHSGRFYQKPIAVLIALAALAALATIALYVRSLKNRAQPSSPARKLYKEGFAAFERTEYNEAIAKCSLALNNNPDQEVKFLSLSYRARSHQALQRLDEALKDFTDALECECEDVELLVTTHIFKGDIHAEKNDHKEAVQAYDSAFKLDPLNKFDKVPLIFFKRGCSKVFLENFQGAVDDFTEAYDPKSADSDFQCDILANRGNAYMGLNKLSMAMKDFKDALKFNPKNAEIRRQILIRMGMIYDAGNQPLEAIGAYTLALECKPISPDESVDILLKRAASKLDAKKPEEAIADLDEAWKCKPEDPNLRAEIRVQRGTIYQQQNKLDLAETEIKEAINCHPTKKQKDIYFLLGQVRAQLMQFKLAIENFTSAMTFAAPKSAARAEFLLHRGWAQLEDNNKEAAFEDWNEGLDCDLETDLVKAKLLYAKCEGYIRDKDHGQVIQNATAALECKFDHKDLERDLYRLRGGAHRKAGHLNKAIEDWDNALGFEFENPGDRASILYAKGVVLQEIGEVDKARHSWEEALRFVTDDELRKRIQGQLDEKSSSLSSSLSSLAGWAWSKMPSSPFSSPNKSTKQTDS